MIWLWSGFFVLIFILLALDLGVFHRHSHRVEMKEALFWTGVWITVGLAFTGVVYLIYEHQWFGAKVAAADDPLLTNDGAGAALRYLTGYLLEKSLSIDNIFVIAMIFNSFGVPHEHRHRVLFWGIIGALVTRGLMIIGGVYLVTRFTWTFYVFGAYLVYVGIRLVAQKHAVKDPKSNLFVRLAHRFLPIGQNMSSGRFTATEGGKFVFTPLVLALVTIEVTDVVFAVDSIPAILAITTDQFIVFTSNVFAILGLRSIYFVLTEMLERFRYLSYALAVILVFIGAKMLLFSAIHIPNLISLAVITAAMTIGTLVSLRPR